MELVEAVMNIMAAEHRIRPWTYQGINILRSLHKTKYFTHVMATARDQKIMCETFFNEILSRNVTRKMMGKPHMSLAECL